MRAMAESSDQSMLNSPMKEDINLKETQKRGESIKVPFELKAGYFSPTFNYKYPNGPLEMLHCLNGSLSSLKFG